MTLPENVQEFWVAGGPLMPWIAATSFGVWLFFLRTRTALLDRLRDETALVGLVNQAVHEAKSGGEDTESAVDRLIRHTGDRMSQEIARIEALTAAAPLLGLLGTVLGMVATFTALSSGHGSADTAKAVAGGISQALITTQVGLVVALPGLFGAARLRRLARQTLLVLEAARAAVRRAEPIGAGA